VNLVKAVCSLTGGNGRKWMGEIPGCAQASHFPTLPKSPFQSDKALSLLLLFRQLDAWETVAPARTLRQPNIG
jgi:hypothetical protein